MSDTERLPILVSIPHAGQTVPEEVADLVALSDEALWAYTDHYTDRIYALENVHLVQNEYSRVIVDPNRAPDDISREYEQAAEGVIVLRTWDGKEVYREEPSAKVVETLIERYHTPYHDKIDEAMPHVQFMIDGHSYLPYGPKLKKDSGAKRPDINLGNVNFTSCTRAHTVFFRDFFEDRGYTVSINFPYAGKYILGHHCHRYRIPGFLVPGIQIEINQGLYMKEDSRDFIPERLEEFQELFAKCVDTFAGEFCS